MLTIAQNPKILVHLTSTNNTLRKIELSLNPSDVFQLTWDKNTSQKLIDEVVEFLYSYAEKKPRNPPQLKLEGTQFQIDVLHQMQKIPFSQQKSYQELALSLERNGAARAIGNACGRNPFPLLIPCHRVLASGGKLGGFSAGIEVKKELLHFEGIHYK
ncbi:MAG: cysteine methyltransferase [Waddliaceae bacterium]|nr:cysteine methyltransferase [Waddliaceae bacterium]